MAEFQARRIFHWQYSGVSIPAFFAAGMTMALGDYYLGAYISWGLFGVFLVAYWLTSDFIVQRQSELDRQRMRNSRKKSPSPNAVDRERLMKGSLLGWKWGGTLLWVVITFACVWATRIRERDVELQHLEGVLYPASDPMPATVCKNVPQDAMVLLFGNSAAYSSRQRLNLFMVDDVPLIWLQKTDDGRLLVNGTLRGEDGRLVVELSNGHYLVNPNAALPLHRPDRSTLVVRDNYGKTIVDLRYMNSRAIRILGNINYGPGRAFIIKKDEQVFDGRHLSNVCIGEFGTAIGVFTRVPQPTH